MHFVQPNEHYRDNEARCQRTRAPIRPKFKRGNDLSTGRRELGGRREVVDAARWAVVPPPESAFCAPALSKANITTDTEGVMFAIPRLLSAASSALEDRRPEPQEVALKCGTAFGIVTSR
jgi:hypothetical protein